MTTGALVPGATMLDPAATADLLRRAVDGGGPIVLAAHVNPDGDALGSALALALGLGRLGGSTAVTFGSEPFVVPTALAFLPAQDLLVPPAAAPAAPRLLVALDTGSLDRLGAVADIAAAADQVLVIDHHASNTCFGDVNLVDPAAASTTMLVGRLLDALGVEIDRDVAAALYAGLSTDTGSFRYQATTPEVHRFAARLLETGIPHAEIARALWDTHPFAYVPLLGTVLARTELEDGLVWTWCAQADLNAAGLRLDDVEGIIDVIRTAVEADVAVVCKQDVDGSWKVSTRSKGGADVGAACTALGGGGHRFAAGFTTRSTPAEAVAAFRAQLPAARLPAAS